jgi:membrane associated rhomboid family serine protease
MFPYRDDNPTLATPVVTLAIIAVNVVVWLAVQGGGVEPGLGRSVCELGLIPGELLGRVPQGTLVPLGPNLACEVGAPAPHKVLTSMFLHGSWFHLLGNMWFLWIFGNNVEDSMGRGRFVAFYLLSGVLAAVGHMALHPGSPIPMVGASGAISGVMGAYLVLYPRVRVHMLLFIVIFVTTFTVPAWMMLFYWVFLQALGGAMTLGSEGGGVAFAAHLGGFVAGAALIKLFARGDLVEAHRRHLRNQERRIVFRDFGRDRWR